MWQCPRCGNDVDEEYDTCWNCLYTEEDSQDFLDDTDEFDEYIIERCCPRCHTIKECLGTEFRKPIDQNIPNYILGLVGISDKCELWVCPTCGRAELIRGNTSQMQR